MQLRRSIDIAAPSHTVWPIASDIEGAPTRISGIKKIEILEPATGPSLVGLKWRETRTWMGRDAIETMWITEATENSHYTTRAERGGAIYVSRLSLEPTGTGTRLTMSFATEATTVGAKLLWTLTGWMAKGALKKIIDQDLRDIKTAVEKRS